MTLESYISCTVVTGPRTLIRTASTTENTRCMRSLGYLGYLALSFSVRQFSNLIRSVLKIFICIVPIIIGIVPITFPVILAVWKCEREKNGTTAAVQEIVTFVSHLFSIYLKLIPNQTNSSWFDLVIKRPGCLKLDQIRPNKTKLDQIRGSYSAETSLLSSSWVLYRPAPKGRLALQF